MQFTIEEIETVIEGITHTLQGRSRAVIIHGIAGGINIADVERISLSSGCTSTRDVTICIAVKTEGKFHRVCD